MSFWSVFAASFTASLVTGFGIYVIYKFADWGERNAIYFMSFAGGVLISVSVIHIAPESLEFSETSPFYFLAGYFGLFLTNQFFQTFFCPGGNCGESKGWISVLGIGFHSFVDGVIYAITFNVSIFTGILAAIGMVLHEFPEGIVSFLLLKRMGIDEKKSSLIALLTAGLSTPLGTLVSFFFIRNIAGEDLGYLLATAGGVLLYVGATHLIPEVEKESKRFSFLTLLGGVLVALIIVFTGH